MSEVVIDANVWRMAETEDNRETWIACGKICYKWLTGLRVNQVAIVVDQQWAIMREYRRVIAPGDFLDITLRQLQREGRIILARIDFESDGTTAILPAELGLENFDRADRKYVAVALTKQPIPPIVNAVDSDWSQNHERLSAIGILVEELCPDALKLLEGEGS